MATAQMKGGPELAAALRALPAKIGKTIGRDAVRAGSVPVENQAKQDVHSITGMTARSIKTTVRARKGRIKATIGPKKAAFRGKQFYADWEMLGHFTGKRPAAKISRSANARQEYIRASQEAGRKFIDGTHVMEHAIESRGDEAATITTTELKNAIEGLKLN